MCVHADMVYRCVSVWCARFAVMHVDASRAHAIPVVRTSIRSVHISFVDLGTCLHHVHHPSRARIHLCASPSHSEKKLCTESIWNGEWTCGWYVLCACVDVAVDAVLRIAVTLDAAAVAVRRKVTPSNMHRNIT